MTFTNKINPVEGACPTNCDSVVGMHERLERAVRGSCDGMWEWDIQTDQVWYAPRYLELLEMTPEEFPTRLESWRRQVHPDDVDAAWKTLEHHVDTSEPLDMELRMATRGGNYRWFRARGTAYYNADDQPMLMAGSIQDIDDLKRTEQMLKEKEAELLQQQKMEAVGSLAGGVAHEFNNLLQAIRGYTSFAQETLEEGTEPYEDLQQVLTASEKATVLTRQLLNFSRPEADDPKACVIDKIIVDLQEMLRPLLPENIEFRVQLGCPGEFLFVDPQQSQQALLNLCNNARDAMPQGGHLLLRTQVIEISELAAEGYADMQPGRYVKVSVTDTGEGISEELQQRIFEPFFSTKEVGKGTGLGLSMVFGMLKQAGGHVQVSSQPGEGTTFRIFLPTCEALRMNDATPDTDHPSGTETILIAEDDPLVREVGRRMLQRAGYQTITACNGEEALELFVSHADRIRLVLLDVVMPRYTGRQVFEWLREEDPHMPVCFCTGYDPAAAQSDSLRALGCEVLEKPYDEKQLLLTIRKVLDETYACDTA